jgi:hypothetical protein
MLRLKLVTKSNWKNTLRKSNRRSFLGDIRNHVIPTAIRYQNTLIENVRGLKEIFSEKTEKNR